MAATSVVPATRKKLREQLRARAALARVQVTTGKPQAPDREYIAVLGAETHRQEQAAMGTTAHPRREDFELALVISVVQAGHPDSDAVVDRVFVLVAELENQLRDDQTIGGNVEYAEVSELPFEDLGPNDDGFREARVHARVRCRAYL